MLGYTIKDEPTDVFMPEQKQFNTVHSVHLNLHTGDSAGN